MNSDYHQVLGCERREEKEYQSI